MEGEIVIFEELCLNRNFRHKGYVVMKLILARHCKATGQGANAELTNEGKKQAINLSEDLCNLGITPSRIVSSPFLRAKQSVEPFSTRKGLEIEVDDRLRERKLSSKLLDNWMEVLERSFTDLDYQTRGGESSNQARHRALSLINEIAQPEMDRDEACLIMTHGNLLSLILGSYDDRFGFEEWKNLTNPDLYLVERTTTGWKVDRLYN